MDLKNIKIIHWLPVILTIAFGIVLRWRNNFSTELIPGINGGYYPFQIKNLIEGNGMGFNDMPFVFIVEALLAKFLVVIGNHNLNDAVLYSSKIIDAVIPPLIAIPIFLFANTVSGRFEKKQLFYMYVLMAFSVLYLSFIAILGSDFQKNAVGLVWIALFLFIFYRYVINNSRIDILLLSGLFILTLLTHIGAFGALICFLTVYGIFYLLSNIGRLKLEKRFLLTAAIVIILGFITLYVIDEKRFIRLGTFFLSPLTFFENPIILFILDKQPIIHGIWLVNFLACNILSIVGFIFLLIRKDRIEKKLQGFVFSIALVGLFLTSPLLGIEWAERFLWIAPVFIIIEYIFIFSMMSRKVFKVALSGFLILLIVYSFRPAMLGKRPHITEESYQELYTIGEEIRFDKNSIILTRHGLEWWAGFVLDVKVGQDYSLTKKEFKNYNHVFLLKQKKGNNFQMIAWSHFLEVDIPVNAILKFEGDYFDLYQIKEPLNYSKETSRPPDTYGVVKQMQEDELTISNERYTYKVRVNPETEISCKNDLKNLQEGIFVELWGVRKPFSLEIVAETIHQIDGKNLINQKN